MNSMAEILSSKTDDFFLENTLPNTLPASTTPLSNNDRLSNANDKSAAPFIAHHLSGHISYSEQSKDGMNLAQLKSMLHSLRDQLDTAIRLIHGEQSLPPRLIIGSSIGLDSYKTDEQVIEGVFNGEKMVGPDGQIYAIPPNYASKSKLVEGDMLKLTISRSGQFIYKQTGPIERQRLKGELVSDPATGHWRVLADGKNYKILTASVTFWQGKSGDEAVFLVPKDGESAWGAVENIIHTHQALNK